MVQTESTNSDTDIHPVVADALRSDDPVRLDVGGGRDPQEGHINVDLREIPEVDVVAPARNLPVPDESVDRIYCNSVVPHLPEPFEAFAEWARVLKPGGELVVKATHANSTGIRADADHEHYSWTSETPKYFSGDVFDYYGGLEELVIEDVEIIGWLRPYRWWLRPPSWLFGKWLEFVENDMADELMKLPLAGGRVIARFRRDSLPDSSDPDTSG